MLKDTLNLSSSNGRRFYRRRVTSCDTSQLPSAKPQRSRTMCDVVWRHVMDERCAFSVSSFVALCSLLQPKIFGDGMGVPLETLLGSH